MSLGLQAYKDGLSFLIGSNVPSGTKPYINYFKSLGGK